MPQQVLTEDIILAAVDGLTARREKLDAQLAELRAMLPGSRKAGAAAAEGAPKKRHFSAAAIARMREAQQRRWAKVRGESQPTAPSPAPAPKPKRKLSAAAKAKLVANLRKARAAKLAKATPAGKKTAPARKKAPVKKAAAKKAPVKKVAAKKTAPAPAQAPAEVAG